MASPARYDVLLFDLGGVLVENVLFERLQALLPARIEDERLKARWLASPAVRALESGRLSADAFARDFVEEWRLPSSPAAFLDLFANCLTGFAAGAIDLVAKLRRRYRVACLSNSNAVHWARFDGFHDLFDVALSSHELGVIKPDRECFERALDACGTRADRVLFFDDSLVNVIAARACGIRTHHVQGFAEVERVIDAERLLA